MDGLRKYEENFIVECELWKQHCAKLDQELRLAKSDKERLLADLEEINLEQENLSLQNTDVILQKYILEKEVDHLRSFTLECKDSFEDYKSRSNAYLDKLSELKIFLDEKMKKFSETTG